MTRAFIFWCVLFLALSPLRLLSEASHHPAAIGTANPPDMALIPPGEFTMGSPEESDGFPDERPERRVFLSGYFLDRFEVTNQA
ncbi:MAG: SUMF1/EgtB/PvdO family nonheme iron enzyme, partial [Nitrospira sp.]